VALAVVALVAVAPEGDGEMFSWLKKNRNFEEIDLNCPRCSIVMRKLKKKDVIIDVCDKCNGMWLDDNEIHKLVEIAKSSSKPAKKKR